MSTQPRWFRLDRHDDPDPQPTPDTGDQTPPTEPATGDATDWKAEAEKWKSLARKNEDRAKANHEAQQQQQDLLGRVAKALNLESEGDAAPDPEYLTQQIEQAQAAAWKSSVELNVHRIASRLGGDAEKLLDSMAFIDSLDDLVDSDPASPDFRTAVESKIQAAIERNPSYKTAPAQPAGPRPDPSQGRGGDTKPADFRTADKATFEAELAKLGLRPRS